VFIKSAHVRLTLKTVSFLKQDKNVRENVSLKQKFQPKRFFSQKVHINDFDRFPSRTFQVILAAAQTCSGALF
jgi:hypothetical protein